MSTEERLGQPSRAEMVTKLEPVTLLGARQPLSFESGLGLDTRVRFDFSFNFGVECFRAQSRDNVFQPFEMG